jgi:hypothetical protein
MTIRSRSPAVGGQCASYDRNKATRTPNTARRACQTSRSDETRVGQLTLSELSGAVVMSSACAHHLRWGDTSSTSTGRKTQSSQSGDALEDERPRYSRIWAAKSKVIEYKADTVASEPGARKRRGSERGTRAKRV